jgi:hypothetical protein
MLRFSIIGVCLIFAGSAFEYFVLLDHFRAFAFLVMSVGLCLNVLVIVVNGGKMPIVTSENNAQMERPYHTTIDESTRLRWLCDVIPIGNYLASIGDVVVTIGIAIATIPFIAPQFGN